MPSRKLIQASSVAGILSFFGLDEYSRLERKYAREIEGKADNQFEEELKDVLRRGILETKKENFDKAEQLFHIGLKMATDMQHQNGITYVLDLMANLALDVKDYEKAERLLVTVMQRLISLKGTSTSDDAIVELSLKMASVQAATGQQEKADLGYRFCIDTQREKISSINAQEDEAGKRNTLALYGMSLDSYGHYLMSCGRVKAASDQFQQALEVAEDLFGEASEQALAAANALATTASMLGQTERADRLFEKTLDLARRVKSDHLASYLVNHGLHHLRKEEFSHANKLCKEALGRASRAGDKATENEADECIRLNRLALFRAKSAT